MAPTSLVHYERFDEARSWWRSTDLADEMLAGDATAVGHAMLRRDLPGS